MIGIDEVGRGCWAGPLLVVAARQKTELPSGLADSKVLSKKKRNAYAPLIAQTCDTGEGWVTSREVDQLGLTEAMRLGVLRALMAIDARSDEIIIMDGDINYCAAKYRNASAVIDADAIYPIVSAASIHAKVARDAYMTALGGDLAVYGFDKHVGYGTKLHHEMLLLYGISKEHRMSFTPIRKLATL
jgi:ribonuclease HII